VHHEIEIVRSFDWQIFGGLSFKKVKSPGVAHSMAFAFLRGAAKLAGVHFKRLPWVLRGEFGETTGRFHFHFLLSGCSAATIGVCFTLMSLWESLGGGQARIHLFDANAGGVEYLAKLGITLGADGYEREKFASSDTLTLAHCVWNAYHTRKGMRGVCGRFGRRGCRPKQTATLAH